MSTRPNLILSRPMALRPFMH